MKIIVIAGPNGAGKTTFAREYLTKEIPGLRFVNGDDIAAELNPSAPDAAAQQAGRIALRRMEAYVANREDFAIETTLSGRAYAARIRRWQAKGYRVAVIYLRLPSADHAVRRVTQRVSEGRHDVPEPVIRRRFARSWDNFVELYRDVADEWQVYDNSGPVPILVARSKGWDGVRESRRRWPVGVGSDGRPPRANVIRDHQDSPARRITMTEHAGRIPKGEPSPAKVLAALTRARDRALARAEATRSGEPHEEPTGKTASGDPDGGRGVIGAAEDVDEHVPQEVG